MSGGREVLRPVDVLRIDWERARRASGVDDRDLASQVAIRAARLVGAQRPPDRVDPELRGQERVAALRATFAWRAATVAVHRFDYVTGLDRFERAAFDEERGYEQKLALDRDVVPPLKEEARSLRAEIRALEERLRRAGGDPDQVAPAIDWSRTLAVDAYVRPEYETAAARRKKAVDFFKRIG